MAYVSTTCLKGREWIFEKDILRVLEIYKKLGIKDIELGAAHDHLPDLKPVVRYQKENDANFIIHTMFPPPKEPFMFNLAYPKMIKRSMAQARKAIEACRILNSDHFSFHAGCRTMFSRDAKVLSNPISFEEAMDNVIRNVQIISDEASEYGIKTAVETLYPHNPYLMMYTVEEFKTLLKEIPSKNLGVLIDIPHCRISELLGKMDIKELLKTVDGRVYEVHVHKFEKNGNMDLEKMEHLPLDDTAVLKDFGFTKEMLKNAKLTLESINLDENQILECADIIGRAVSVL